MFNISFGLKINKETLKLDKPEINKMILQVTDSSNLSDITKIIFIG